MSEGTKDAEAGVGPLAFTGKSGEVASAVFKDIADLYDSARAGGENLGSALGRLGGMVETVNAELERVLGDEGALSSEEEKNAKALVELMSLLIESENALLGVLKK